LILIDHREGIEDVGNVGVVRTFCSFQEVQGTESGGFGLVILTLGMMGHGTVVEAGSYLDHVALRFLLAFRERARVRGVAWHGSTPDELVSTYFQ